MLKDTVRTKSYYRAIVGNKHLFKDKIVLDVGCGTGILSLFAVDAGAAHVDKSDIIDYAREIVKINNYDSRITLIKSRIEDTELPVDEVDIIISEWMGYCLLFEAMLESVLYARDKWLAHEGLMFPDIANIYAAGIEDEAFRDEKIEWWSSVYGYVMTPLRDAAIKEPLVDYVNREAVVTTDALVRRFNLYTVSKDDIASFKTKFTLCCKRKDFIHAFVFFFSVEFNSCHKQIVICTSPESRPTHWKQSVFYVPKPFLVYPDQEIPFIVSFAKNPKNPRNLDITLSLLDVCSEVVLDTLSYTLA